VYLYLLCFVFYVLCFLYCFVYIYLFLFVLSLLVQGLLSPNDKFLQLVIIIIIIIIIIKGTCMLINVAISGDRNVIKKKPRRF